MSKELPLLHFGSVGIKSNLKCNSCEFADNPDLQTNCMSGVGNQNSPDFMIVGVNHNREEDEQGRPWSLGSNAELLHGILESCGLDKSRIYFTNAIKCHAFEAEIQEWHWKKCNSHFIKELRRVKPKAIISLGAKTLKWLTGFTGVRRFRQHGLPCAFAPEILVYPVEQPLSIEYTKTYAEYEDKKAAIEADILWLRSRADAGKLHKADDVELNYKLASTVEEVEEFTAELKTHKEICFDIETCTANFKPTPHLKDEHYIYMISFSTEMGKSRVIPLYAKGVKSWMYWSDEDYEKVFNLTADLFRTEGIVWFGLNAVSFDKRWVDKKFGSDITIEFECLYASHLLDEEARDYRLEALALTYTKMLPWKSEHSLTEMMQDTNMLALYASRDTDSTFRLKKVIEQKMEDYQLRLHKEIQVPIGLLFNKMSDFGLKVSQENLAILGGELEARMKQHLAEIKTLKCVQMFELGKNHTKRALTFNPGSTDHVRFIMRDILGLPCLKETNKGGYSVDKSVLEAYEDEPFVKALLYYRRCKTIYDNYFKKIRDLVKERGEVLHASFFQHRTVTGRPASKDPNLFTAVRADTVEKAGIKDGKILKDIYIPQNDLFVQADYCVTADTKILTDKGLRNIVDVRDGDRAIQPDGSSEAITALIGRGKKQVYELKTRSGFTLKCTLDHRIKVWSEEKGEHWIKVGDITNEKILVQPLQKLIFTFLKSLTYLDEEETYDLTVENTHAYIGNGFINHNCQQELRVLAALSKDKTLMGFYEQGLDVHKATAAKANGIALEEVTKAQRTAAKKINFGIVYGQSEMGLAESFVTDARAKAKKDGVRFTRDDEEEARAGALRFIVFHQQTFPQVWEWIELQKRIVEQHRKQITPFGRTRRYYRLNSEAFRQASNFPIQSTCADITFTALLRLDELFQELDFKSVICLSVYDSVLIDTVVEERDDVAIAAKTLMESLDFPFLNGVKMTVDVETGPTYGRLEEYDFKEELWET